MIKITILMKDGVSTITHYNAVYVIYTGSFLVVTLETNEQFRVDASLIDVFEMEKTS